MNSCGVRHWEVALQRVDAGKMGSSQKSRLWELHFWVRATLGYEHEWEWWGGMGAEQWVLGTVHMDPEGTEDWQGRALKCARMNQDLPGMRGGS